MSASWNRRVLGLVPGLMLASLLLTPAPAAEPAGLPGSEWRYHLVREPESPAGDVGRVVVWPQTAELPRVVVTRDGQAVGSWLMEAQVGEPMRLLFDCSGGGNYVVHLGAGLPEQPEWTPRAGLVQETRRWREGDPKNVNGMLQLWADSGPRDCRDLVEQIFHGFNPFGSDQRFASRYQGWLQIDRTGTWQFATASDDASALWIDGELVASWPGWHGMTEDGGHRFKHAGEIRLVEGLHQLEYLHVQGDGGSGTLAAWKPPGAKQAEVIPASAFAAVARYQLRKLDGGPGLRWEMSGHCASGPHLVVDTELRAVELREGDRVTWRGDDGSRAEGSTWRHSWIRPGLRLVRVQIERDGQTILEREQPIRIRQQHHQRHQYPEDLAERQRAALQALDLARLPAGDLAELVAYVRHLDDKAWQAQLADRLLAAGRDADAESAAEILALAIAIQHPELQRYEAAIGLFDWLHRSAAVPKPIRAAAGLHQAGLQIQIMAQTELGRTLLEGLDETALEGGDRRLAAIYRADVALYAGRPDEALRRYRQAGTTAHAGDLKYAVKRRVRLETARDYIRREEADAAEKILRSIEWETPEERMGGEMVELQAEVWLLRGEWRFAVARLPVVIAARAEDPRLPELLLLQLRAELAAGRHDRAHAAAALLQQEHPFSEAAARLSKYFDPTSLEETP